MAGGAGLHTVGSGCIPPLWEDAQTGEQRASVEIVVDDLSLLDRPMVTTTQEDEQDSEEPLWQLSHCQR